MPSIQNIKFDKAIADYANKSGRKVATCQLKDGSSLKILTSPKGWVDFINIKDDKFVSAKGLAGGKFVAENLAVCFADIQKNCADGVNVLEEWLKSIGRIK